MIAAALVLAVVALKKYDTWFWRKSDEVTVPHDVEHEEVKTDEC